MSEVRIIYVTLLKKEAMSQPSWVQLTGKVTGMLEVHADGPAWQWESVSDARQQSFCWELRLNVDLELCVRRLLSRIVDAYACNPFKWSRADVTFVTAQEE